MSKKVAEAGNGGKALKQKGSVDTRAIAIIMVGKRSADGNGLRPGGRGAPLAMPARTLNRGRRGEAVVSRFRSLHL